MSKYPESLPGALQSGYVYLPDCGHSIKVAIASEIRGQGPDAISDAVCPASVKTVLRAGWTVSPEGIPICDLPYDREFGLRTPEEDFEW